MLLSILGLYECDNSIFDGFEPPTFIDEKNVVHTLNRDDVINNILLQCAELEIMYPSTQIMKFAIGVWSASNARTWEKLYKTMFLEYNPLWNVDADITQNRKIARDRDGTNENINTVSGFNSEDWSNANKDNGSFKDNEDISDTFTERRTGNIGITSSQTLVESERSVSEFSIVEYITQSFKERFCILVY